jgi:type II restriction/modification system DNA methylase subunit YeeA
VSEITGRMRDFVAYGQTLAGYEKGEAQVFCDRLFRAFGHDGYKEAGAALEFQVRKPRGRGVKFADLLWTPRVLIEMKSRGELLARHYRQAFEYWLQLVPDRPRYVVLCNFDDFWVYDFNTQLDSPVDQAVPLDGLPDRYSALNFLFPSNPRPLFGNDKVQVTREAADKVATVFNALVARREP